MCVCEVRVQVNNESVLLDSVDVDFNYITQIY